MTKRPRTASFSKSNEKPIIATFYERWDVAMFNAIAELVLPPEIEYLIDEMSYDINNASSSHRKVNYRRGKFDQGRIYGTGYQSIPGWIRRLCAHQYYLDIDIQNCGPTLFAQLLDEWHSRTIVAENVR